jgi:RND family efflux transporter MFP subunit
MDLHISKMGSFKRLLKNKYVIGVIILAIIAVSYYSLRSDSSIKIESTTVAIGNVIERVGVTGKILPTSKVDLAFEVGGAISHIYVKVGDRVSRGTLIASLESASGKLRPEELAASQAQVDAMRVSLESAKTNAINAFRSGYVQVQGAIINYVDSSFMNPQSVNPTIQIPTGSYTTGRAINSQKILVTEALGAWKSEVDGIATTSNPAALLLKANSYLFTMKALVSELSRIVGDLNPGNAGLTQSGIDVLVSNMNLAMTGVNQSISSITTAKSSLDQAESNYDSSASTLASTIAKGQILSPIDGIVTRVDPHEGEYITPGQSGFTVQSEGAYKIEAYVPEADIAKIAVGNHADITLDAYGSGNIFDATVTLIDPAETVLEGVPTYKVTLLFDKPDTRIKSGMTANTEILTRERDNVLYVPTRSIIDDNGQKAVRMLNSDGKTFINVPVVVGLKGSDGTSEIVSGLQAGDEVVTYVK